MIKKRVFPSVLIFSHQDDEDHKEYFTLLAIIPYRLGIRKIRWQQFFVVFVVLVGKETESLLGIIVLGRERRAGP